MVLLYIIALTLLISDMIEDSRENEEREFKERSKVARIGGSMP